MACGLTHIRRGTASALKKVNITKAIDLGADLERMYSCEWKAEIDYFLGNRLN